MLYKQPNQLIFFLALFLMLLSTASFAQTGTFDIRFLIHSVDCATEKLFFDIEVRADEPGTEFYLGDQNYRFSFNRNILENPQLVEELEVSEYIQGGDGPLGFSFYSPHSLTGTLDTIVSYNVEMQGGDGIYIASTDYVSVGRMSLDIVNFDTIIGLRFHTDIPRDFPNAFVGQHYENALIPTIVGAYGDYFHDFSQICNNDKPITTNDTGVSEGGEAVTVCLLDNDIDPENKLDPSTLTLLSTPPASEGILGLDTNTHCITFVPAAGFVGEVTPFEYEICDIGKYIPTHRGDANPYLVALPDPKNPNILITPSTCSTATVNITIRPDNTSTGLVTANNNAALFSLNTFPNPANDVLNVSYTLTQKANVSIAIWNILGQAILQLDTETLPLGKHNKSLNISELNTGNYLFALSVDGKIATQIILKL